MIRDSCRLSFRSTPIREYLRVPYWLLFNVCPAIYAFPHFESRTPNVSVFYITEWSFWCSNEFNGGQCEMKLRRLQQASFLPCTVENDKRQLQAQSQSRSNIQIGNIIAWCLFGCSSIVDGYYAHPLSKSQHDVRIISMKNIIVAIQKKIVNKNQQFSHLA